MTEIDMNMQQVSRYGLINFFSSQKLDHSPFEVSNNDQISLQILGH